MNNQLVATPINEQIFLKKNALLSILVGLIFLLEPVWLILTPLISEHSQLEIISSIIRLTLVLTMLIVFVKTSASVRKAGKNAFWYSNFNDEYLNYVNNKAFKYSFYITAGFIGFYAYLGKHFITLFNDMPVSDFALFILGLSFIGYGLPIIVNLRGEDG